MEKEFIPYEEALAMKELGFDEECFGFYFISDSLFIQQYSKKQQDNICQAPLYQQAFRWFREEHQLTVQDYIYNRGHDIYAFVIYDLNKRSNLYDSCYNDTTDKEEIELLCLTYEEAELNCLRKLIEIVKEKQSLPKLLLN
jgi:hypothetical protein